MPRPRKPLTEAQLARNRAAKPTGRPKGSKNKATLVLEAAKRRFDLAVAARVEELFALQLGIAQQGATAAGPANSAIEAMLDRAFGKASQRIETVGDTSPVTVVNVFAPNTAPEDLPVVGVYRTPEK